MKTLEEALVDWEAVIGLEIHTELTTLKTKMFCSCPIEHGADPNTHTCPVCLGLPGALPVPNKAAIESIVLAGLATGCEIEKRSMFYRKNYFYPDMSKNFQTTQGPVAFCMRGGLDLEVSGSAAKERPAGTGVEKSENGSYATHIGITRIHMEEDAAKMVHIGGVDGRIAGATHSLVDYNRCGMPLIELVTEPDLRTPEEARLFMQKLRQIFLAIGISDCSMESGSMRADGNVSVRRRGSSELGTKTELKNMNSFKNLHDGLAYEICRQVEELENGGLIRQETRHWDPTNKTTVCMRVKETADDYRLFPEPDLAPYDLSDEWIESVRAKLPELPDAKIKRFMDDFGLSKADAAGLVSDLSMAAFFDEAMLCAIGDGDDADTKGTSGADANRLTQGWGAHLAKPIANLMLNDLAAYLNAQDNQALESQCMPLTPAQLVELAQLIASDTISSKQAKEVFAIMMETGENPAAIVEVRGMKQVSDAGELEEILDDILAQNPDKVQSYRGGKTGLMGFFVGQAMKATKGQGNPKMINELLAKKLEG